MSYQPPGPYPVFPQYPGGAEMPTTRPPLPATVLRAHYCILAGAVLAVASAVAAVAESDRFKEQVSSSFGAAVVVAACLTAAIEGGLWIWMAYATKAGKHWARILCTVFFGLEATGQVIGNLTILATSRAGDNSAVASPSDSVAGQIIGWLTVGVGLAAIILLWNKASGPYFKPPMPYPVPYGYPGYPGGPGGPMPPYPYPVMPQQQPQPPQQDGTPQQPGDPWSTTPKD